MSLVKVIISYSVLFNNLFSFFFFMAIIFYQIANNLKKENKLKNANINICIY